MCMASNESLFIVTAHVDGRKIPQSFHVAAESPERAEEVVGGHETVTDVLSSLTTEFSGVFRVEVSGKPEEIGDAVDHLEHLSGQVEADMDVDDVTPTVWPAGDDLDDDDVLNVAVTDWDDLELRITGADIEQEDDERGGGNGVLSATPAAMQARDGSTVELVAGNRTLVRAVKETPERLPAKGNDGNG